MESARLVPKLLTGLVVGVLVVAGFLLFADLQKVLDTIRRMPGEWLLLAFILTFISYLVRLWKWHVFSRWSGFTIGFFDNAAIFFIGLMMSITPGKAGELLKGYYLEKRAGVSYAASIPVIFYDRLTDVLAMLALVSIGMTVYPLGITSVVVLAAAIVLFFILLQRRKLLFRLIEWVTVPNKLRRFRGMFHDFYEHTLQLLQWKKLVYAFVISFVAWLFECLSLFVILQAFDVDMSVVASILTFSLGTIAGAVSMIPGGLGAAEGSITGLLIYFGVEANLAVTISLLIRFVTLWFGVVLGIIIFVLTRKRLVRREHGGGSRATLRR
ncbi:lysylphosphatidylglycerol synthase transmembrane domain-containing protein [Aquibacillus salsiterrae]|uniref:Phosphatidylglycerol lysyltransferase n=1 Tax=Aquibacillus salsiterrae TaxID=2950439 RepID=A0A9X3WFW4_9BACI|nr:lysylphosphatidylglycerol synthase transmembrane domain-containing protein [Aquibacillus salsiterrae]MDC3416699.1 flippase-like domain-containing protein [Aquibacillus salsiterrae]